jgi:cytochrome c556
MQTLMIARIFCVLVCITAIEAAASDDPVDDLKKGQPKDVAQLIDRFAGCNHWSGEEPYDAERKKEIAQAMVDLRCERLAADEAAAIKRYAKQPKTIRALKQAKEVAY